MRLLRSEAVYLAEKLMAFSLRVNGAGEDSFRTQTAKETGSWPVLDGTDEHKESTSERCGHFKR